MNPGEPMTPVAQLKFDMERLLLNVRNLVGKHREDVARAERNLVAANAELSALLDAQGLIRKAFPDAK